MRAMSSTGSTLRAPVVLGDVVPGDRVRDAVLVLGGAALTALLAQVAIDVPPSPVPITGQTLAVGLVGATLGARRGASSMALYAFLGLFLPVFSEGSSGWHVIWGATGGYILGFIVAAYVVGWPISTSADLPALGLPACTAPDEPRCILSWMTFSDPPNPDFIFHEWAKTKGYNGGERRRQDTLCVNPISGVQNGAAPPQDNPGTLIPSGDMRSASLEPGAVGAHCRDGLLILDGVPPQLGSFVLPGNNYHVYDYALFWGAVRRDAERRLAGWQR
jgi:hypothetical protein